jgi:plastocyanin
VRKWFVITLIALAGGSGGAVAGTEAYKPTTPATPAAVTPAAEPRISIAKFAFGPNTVTVPAGTTVTWTNRDADSHTVTSTAGAFSSPALDRGETFSYRFATPGTYTYFCALHPHMTAQVIVN